ncbi:MAG: MaoC family dehydratase [Candidatus Sungbacteria bacterium]|nr:MaoC family dehydratase [Candidatus Sungbacteria bacterium]
MVNPKDLLLKDISVGDTASFSRIFTRNDVLAFARLSGDQNPLHLDEAYARTTRFGRRLAHGMLVGSLCSTLVGMYLPGKRCLYLSQTLFFRKPVFIGDTVVVQGVVRAKSESTGVLEIGVSITKDDEEVLTGIATVQVLI